MEEKFRQDTIEKLKIYVRESLQLDKLSDNELLEKINELIMNYSFEQYISIEDKIVFSQAVFSSIRGLGILDMILKDDDITEVMINGHDTIFIEKKGKLNKMNARFESEKRLNDIIQRIVGEIGREVNELSPIVDARLLDGSRVNIVLPPISLVGPVVTIRKFSKVPMTVEQLLKYKSITQEAADKLKLLVESKYNMFICGGTGSGKTTFLNAMSNFIPKNERVITIEDSAELQIVGVENLVSLETRNSNAAGIGRVSIRDLIKSSLRMRPERIVVGEVRGEEALDMLQAMNTGHDGSLSTGHANSTHDMLSRLETMVLTGSAALPLEAVRQQIASALDIIVHLSRLRDHTRKVMEISEVLGYKDGKIILNPLWKFEENEHTTTEKVSGELVRTKNKMENVYKLRMFGSKVEF